jgi:hypothetical protein
MRRHGAASSCASEGLDNAAKACYNEASNLLCTTPKQEARQPEGSKPSGLLFFACNASKSAARERRCDWSTSRLLAFSDPSKIGTQRKQERGARVSVPLRCVANRREGARRGGTAAKLRGKPRRRFPFAEEAKR